MQGMLYVTVFGGMLQIARRRLRVAASMDEFASWGRGWQSRGAPIIAAAGVCEGISAMMLPFFAAQLPGSMLTVLAQSLLPFSMIFSCLLLGRRYDVMQILGVLIVLCGVAISSAGFSSGPGVSSNAGASLSALGPGGFVTYSLGLTSAYAFLALALLCKEAAFSRFAKQHGSDLDASVVVAHASRWQLGTVLACWPLAIAFERNLVFSASAIGLTGGVLVGVFLLVNMCYCLITTLALKRLSSVTTLVLNVLATPAGALIFGLNLPILGRAPFSPLLPIGLLVIVGGQLCYHRPWSAARGLAKR